MLSQNHVATAQALEHDHVLTLKTVNVEREQHINRSVRRLRGEGYSRGEFLAILQDRAFISDDFLAILIENTLDVRCGRHRVFPTRGEVLIGDGILHLAVNDRHLLVAVELILSLSTDLRELYVLILVRDVSVGGVGDTVLLHVLERDHGFARELAISLELEHHINSAVFRGWHERHRTGHVLTVLVLDNTRVVAILILQVQGGIHDVFLARDHHVVSHLVGDSHNTRGGVGVALVVDVTHSIRMDFREDELLIFISGIGVLQHFLAVFIKEVLVRDNTLTDELADILYHEGQLVVAAFLLDYDALLGGHYRITTDLVVIDHVQFTLGDVLARGYTPVVHNIRQSDLTDARGNLVTDVTKLIEGVSTLTVVSEPRAHAEVMVIDGAVIEVNTLAVVVDFTVRQLAEGLQLDINLDHLLTVIGTRSLQLGQRVLIVRERAQLIVHRHRMSGAVLGDIVVVRVNPLNRMTLRVRSDAGEPNTRFRVQLAGVGNFVLTVSIYRDGTVGVRAVRIVLVRVLGVRYTDVSIAIVEIAAGAVERTVLVIHDDVLLTSRLRGHHPSNLAHALASVIILLDEGEVLALNLVARKSRISGILPHIRQRGILIRTGIDCVLVSACSTTRVTDGERRTPRLASRSQQIPGRGQHFLSLIRAIRKRIDFSPSDVALLTSILTVLIKDSGISLRRDGLNNLTWSVRLALNHNSVTAAVNDLERSTRQISVTQRGIKAGFLIGLDKLDTTTLNIILISTVTRNNRHVSIRAVGVEGELHLSVVLSDAEGLVETSLMVTSASILLHNLVRAVRQIPIRGGSNTLTITRFRGDGGDYSVRSVIRASNTNLLVILVDDLVGRAVQAGITLRGGLGGVVISLNHFNSTLRHLVRESDNVRVIIGVGVTLPRLEGGVLSGHMVAAISEGIHAALTAQLRRYSPRRGAQLSNADGAEGEGIMTLGVLKGPSALRRIASKPYDTLVVGGPDSTCTRGYTVQLASVRVHILEPLHTETNTREALHTTLKLTSMIQVRQSLLNLHTTRVGDGLLGHVTIQGERLSAITLSNLDRLSLTIQGETLLRSLRLLDGVPARRDFNRVSSGAVSLRRERVHNLTLRVGQGVLRAFHRVCVVVRGVLRLRGSLLDGDGALRLFTGDVQEVLPLTTLTRVGRLVNVGGVLRLVGVSTGIGYKLVDNVRHLPTDLISSMGSLVVMCHRQIRGIRKQATTSEIQSRLIRIPLNLALKNPHC